MDEGHLPHLLFYGPPGTGKTSTILACARQLYTPKEFSSMVLECNASDDRGINVVRQQILSFASTRTLFNSGFKLIILDEADAMTNDAQNALRRIIEKFTDNCRFCFICNYLSKIIPAIQSRCTRFRFGPLLPDQIIPRLDYVIEQENVKTTEDGRKALLTLSGGDMRKVLNILQSTAMAYDEVTEDNVYTCVAHPLRVDITNMINWLLNERFDVAYKNIMGLKTAKGLALQDMLTEFHLYIHRIDFPAEVRIHLIQKLSDIEVRVCDGASEKIQVSAVIAAFTQAKEIIAKKAEVAS
ncbi:Replication factor C (RF-C) subunit [Halocaridina rubra]|uniref:Activator 1 subunit 5 n=1 Tax=Halocaridina rubra TaxID=373956 RepID=A0AAN9A246_HALRR